MDIYQCPYYCFSTPYTWAEDSDSANKKYFLDIHECTLDIKQIRPYPEIQKYENYPALICCIDWYKQRQYEKIDNYNINNCYFLRSLNYLIKQIERIDKEKRLTERELLLYAKYHDFIKKLPIPNTKHQLSHYQFYDELLKYIIDGQTKTTIKNRIGRGLFLECKTNESCPYKAMIIEKEI